eukprot:Em0486g2a
MNVHDDTIPVSIQMMSCKVLLNLVESIRVKSEQDTGARELLDGAVTSSTPNGDVLPVARNLTELDTGNYICSSLSHIYQCDRHRLYQSGTLLLLHLRGHTFHLDVGCVVSFPSCRDRALSPVSKKIKIFNYYSMIKAMGFNKHFPEQEMACTAKLISLCYNTYHKVWLLSSDYDVCLGQAHDL